MMKLLTSNWHMGRIFRAVVGLIGLGLGLFWKDSLMGLAGGILLFMGLTDTGCGPKGCAVPTQKKDKTDSQ